MPTSERYDDLCSIETDTSVQVQQESWDEHITAIFQILSSVTTPESRSLRNVD